MTRSPSQFVVGDGALHVGRRRVAIAEISNVAVEQTTPRVGLLVTVAGIVGMAVVPLLIASFAGADDGGNELRALGLCLAGLALFACMFRILFAEEESWVVVETAAGAIRAFRGQDPEGTAALAIELVAVLAAAQAKKPHERGAEVISLQAV